MTPLIGRSLSRSEVSHIGCTRCKIKAAEKQTAPLTRQQTVIRPSLIFISEKWGRSIFAFSPADWPSKGMARQPRRER